MYDAYTLQLILCTRVRRGNMYGVNTVGRGLLDASYIIIKYHTLEFVCVCVCVRSAELCGEVQGCSTGVVAYDRRDDDDDERRRAAKGFNCGCGGESID